MVIIAVAGGTGGVGKTIVESLVGQSQHQVIVLTRSEPRTDLVSDRTRQVQVDYNDIPSLVQVLEQHAIHTIISAIGIFDATTSQSQLNLIQAAEISNVTKRFVPSEYSFIQTKDLLPVDPSIQHWLDAAELLQKSHLQYTRVIPGFFMDYWGMPVVRTNLTPCTFGINIQHCQAAIPGDGNDVMCMTYTYDMAAFLLRLLDVEDWPEFSIVVGDEVTYNQLLEMAEEIRGQKFQVTYDSEESIKDGRVTLPPMPEGNPYSPEDLQEMTALVSRLTIAGVFKLPDQNRLNDRFPDLQPVKMRQFLQDAWRNYKGVK
ncbi:isoflavone reductase homolog P3 [Aspergillus udagawae]|uniref:Isoflavone reductase homolog P3 n=1 Tax=Aspergillus udagawae TaxID=91492 RepID=A0ABQ1ADT6_9EURO|nr:isoflavone reductase homolog P3 [Aspergillus udagawae]GFG08772.1 isoflavone reductase homolog P3 [Aspergillus udagawae]